MGDTMKRALNTLILTGIIVIPTFLIIFLSEQVNWFSDPVEKMSNTEKIIYYSNKLHNKPGDTDALLGRGQCYYLENDYQKALDDFNSAINIDPTDSHAYYLRALAKMAILDDSGAEEDLRHSLELDPDNKLAKMHYDNLKKKAHDW